MIEQALYFAVGFLVALFGAVVATPTFSRRALRLAETHMRMQARITEKHVAVERDSLLAMHAVELVRMEYRLGVAENDAMVLRAVVGRQSVQVAALEAHAAERECIIFDMHSEIDKGVAERRNLEIVVAASQIALHTAFAQRDRAQSNEAAATVRLSEFDAEASRNRARIAILVARAENLEELLGSTEAAKEKAEKSVAEAAERSRGGELQVRLRQATSGLQDLRESLERTEAGQDEGRKRISEPESRLLRRERVREETLTEDGRRLGAIFDGGTALSAAQAGAVEFEAHLAAITEEASATGGAASIRAQKPNTAQAATEVSLRASPANLEALRRENDTLRARIFALAGARDARGDTALRTSIEHLGREVNRLFAGDRDSSGPKERMLSGR